MLFGKFPDSDLSRCNRYSKCLGLPEAYLGFLAKHSELKRRLVFKNYLDGLIFFYTFSQFP